MKLSIILSLLAVAFCHADSNGRAKRALSTSVLESLIEQFREAAQTEDKNLGLPLLEPYSADSLALQIDEDTVTVNSTVSNLVVEGLTGFTVDKVSFSLIGVRFQLGFTWPSINLTTQYTLDGEVAGVLPMYGSGDLSVETTNLAFAVDLRISSANSRLYVRSLSSTLSLEAIKISATGLLDNEDFSSLASAVVSDLVPQLIVDYNDEIIAVINEVLIETIDSYIGSMTLSELLALDS